MDQNSSALRLQLQALHRQSAQLRAELSMLPPRDVRRAPLTCALAGIHRRYARLASEHASICAAAPILERIVGA